FMNDGKKIVMAVGTRGEAGNDDKHLGKPTDLVWLPDGTFFVSDGEDTDPQRRVVKYAKTGKYLTSWRAEDGELAGFESNSVHGIAVDANRRVYLAHRGSGKNRDQGRVLIFDENGKFLNMWTGFKGIERTYIAQDGFAWVQEGSEEDSSLI